MEERVTSTFRDIRDRLPGLEMYQQIYDGNSELNEQISSKIVEAYDGFVSFCLAALDFYTRGPLRMFSPPLPLPTH